MKRRTNEMDWVRRVFGAPRRDHDLGLAPTEGCCYACGKHLGVGGYFQSPLGARCAACVKQSLAAPDRYAAMREVRAGARAIRSLFVGGSG